MSWITALYKMKDLAIAIVIEILMMAFIALDTGGDELDNQTLNQVSNLSGVNDLGVTVILCTLYRFGASMEDIMKDIDESRISAPGVATQNTIEYEPIASGSRVEKP
ncbi:hypothetical protein HDU76_010131 [Blyttiomyces sp. JEL0837]|nr:hypothetical protein HDU76_010131 [Blyttiomyces sp. JEL0837]